MELDLQPVEEGAELDVQPLDLQPVAEPVAKRVWDAVKGAWGAVTGEETTDGALGEGALPATLVGKMPGAEPELRTLEEQGRAWASANRAAGLGLAAVTPEAVKGLAEEWAGPPAEEPMVNWRLPPTAEKGSGTAERVAASVLYPEVAAVWGPEVAAEVNRRVINLGVSLPEFFTSLPGLATLAAGPAGAVAAAVPRVGPAAAGLLKAGVGGYFFQDMARSVLDQARAAGENWDQMDTPARAGAIVDAMGTAALAGTIGGHLGSAALPFAKAGAAALADRVKPGEWLRLLRPKEGVKTTEEPILPARQRAAARAEEAAAPVEFPTDSDEAGSAVVTAAPVTPTPVVTSPSQSRDVLAEEAAQIEAARLKNKAEVEAWEREKAERGGTVTGADGEPRTVEPSNLEPRTVEGAEKLDLRPVVEEEGKQPTGNIQQPTSNIEQPTAESREASGGGEEVTPVKTANEQSLSFEEQMAAFSGDKRALEKVALENQVRQLEMLRSGHFEQMRKARDSIGTLEQRTIPYQTRQVAESQRRAAVFGEAFGAEKDYTLEAGGKTYTGRKEVAAALDEVFKTGLARTQEYFRKYSIFGSSATDLGRVRLNGQELELTGMGSADAKGIIDPTKIQVGWKFTDGGDGGRSTTGAGFFHSLAASLERVAGAPDFHARSLANEERNLRELKGFIQQPFEREGELGQARERLAALTAELENEGKTPPPSDQREGEKASPEATGSDISGAGEVEHGFSGNTRLVRAAAQDLGRIRNLVAPQTAGGPARFAGNLLRELNARMANELARADVALRRFRADFDRTPVKLGRWKYDPTVPLPRNFEFIRAYETGNVTGLAAGDRLAAAELHRINRADVARVQALGTGALTTFYQNYFPHIWEDPKRAAAVIGKLLGRSPLEGPKAFLKQRTHQLFEEGLAAGLKPVHDNPVDLWLLKKREVERYILAHDFVGKMKEAGLVRFKYAFGRTPEGWARVKDNAFTVYGPPTVTVKEAFDAGMREATLKLLQDLGVPHQRLARIGGQRWGYERETPGVPGSERIVTKFAGPDFVIWHELGHVLDSRYADLKPLLTATDLMNQELRALADLRLDATSTPSERRNVHTAAEKVAVVLQAYVHAPELMAKTAPTVKVALESFIKAHPELEPLNDIHPGLRLGVGEAELSHGGLLKLGDWIMPEAAAQVVNNYLSPGWNPHLWYRTLRQTSNLLNGVQLGLSAFHLGFTSLDAATSRLAVALEDAARGKVGQALTTAASVPVSPLTNIRTGAKLRSEILKPGSHPELAALARAVEQAGGRTGLDAFWRTEFTRRMTRAWHEGGLQWATLPIRLPLAAWEQTMRPILEYVVPRQKLGVFADLAQRELVKLGPAADEATTREAMRKAWDSVDNRMGQVVYDNLFYNRAVKDVALLAFRAYGWQLGKYREGIGAVTDTVRAGGALARGEKPEFTHRMAYAIALPVMVGTIGGLMHYLMTGQKPEEPRDYFMPRTGELDPNGNAVRLNLPSYVKDVISYQKHPVTSVGHSLNPLLGAMFDLLQNKDFYDVAIRSTEDPLWRQGGAVAEFAAKQFVPFSVSGAAKLREDAAPAWKQVAPFFGVTPVPRRLTLTPAQELASEIMAAAMPTGARTREQFDRSKLLKEIVADIKTGKPAPEWLQALAGGLDKRVLAPNTMEVMLQHLKYNTLQFQVSHFTPEAALGVWALANAEEKEQLRGILATKIAKSRTLWPEQKLRMAREMIGNS